ncbi:hypothetical protein PM082_023365 [Marasmius tenuissimus]|nr:hypothetical protein PM082_023365 [Marasmius tenuissimus]
MSWWKLKCLLAKKSWPHHQGKSREYYWELTWRRARGTWAFGCKKNSRGTATGKAPFPANVLFCNGISVFLVTSKAKQLLMCMMTERVSLCLFQLNSILARFSPVSSPLSRLWPFLENWGKRVSITLAIENMHIVTANLVSRFTDRKRSVQSYDRGTGTQ